jgi:hypothetical protein
MKISTAMTTYNGASYLREQLDRIFAQVCLLIGPATNPVSTHAQLAMAQHSGCAHDSETEVCEGHA